MEINFPKLEKKILRYWKENRIFEKSIEQRAKARNFVFYEGPPTANAQPGIHHVLARIFKDIICRYKTMQGFKVLRKAGWDAHGLPVELEIEKKLGLKSKKDIERYGIAKFNRKCKESVWRYKKDWEKLTERIGFWLDMENPYITYQPDYIETVWWILKRIWQKGLLYKDYKVVPYCPRCGTSLSSHEVALGYEKIKEPAIYIKFKIQKPSFHRKRGGRRGRSPLRPSKFKNSYLLVWTTTPWTLPGNVAVAVNPEFTYAKVKVNNESAMRTSSSSSPSSPPLEEGTRYLILAKERMETCGIKGKITQEFKGKDLIGLEYEPLFDFIKPDKKSYFVIAGDFVSTEEGTGLVHIAPAFGEEDMATGKENNLPVLLTVDEEGKFKPEVKNWAGMFVKNADQLIIEDLRKRNLLFKEELYEHDYPFCWRCDSPLLYYAKESWFINMQKVKKDLIKNNQKINWIPAHLKEGRFGEWLREIKDWALTRERYWGTPLPIWQCEKCGYQEVVGSKEDLRKQKFSTNKYFIFRHGETIYQTEKKGVIYNWPDDPSVKLTENGERDIKNLTKKLKDEKIDLIYSSDIYRAYHTAEIIAKELNLKIITDCRLRDINLGIYHGKTKKEFYRDFPDMMKRFYDAPKKGESWLDCKKRIIKFIKDIEKKHKRKRILIVSHGDPLWLLEGITNGFTNKELIDEILKDNFIKTGQLRKIEFRLHPYNNNGELDFHRPFIDEVEFFCKKCDSKMKRVSEVIDCWFDSGSMPFAQGHWPFASASAKASADKQNQKIAPPELFPADYISEAIDQTRGWFYTLLAISTLLGKGTSYKNVISLGHVLDKKGEKMSKSKGNVVDPWYIVEKYGADVTRWYFFTVNQPGDSKLFSEKDVAEALRRFILTFWNCFVFYNTYAKSRKFQKKNQLKSRTLLDKWIISKLNKLILNITDLLDKYDVTSAARLIEDFIVNNLSLWYVRRSRRRFQKPKNKKELKEASETLSFVLLTLIKLTAPFVPFLSDNIYQKICNLRSKICNFSVHLEDWPKVNKKLIDKKLEKKMEKIREIVAKALAERVKAKIKIRQPLNELRTTNYELRGEKELLELIEEEVNVKKITFGKTFKLDTKITLELKEEGIIREIIRNIQEMRKKAGLKPKDKIVVSYFGSEEINKILEKNKEFILKEGNVKKILIKKGKEVFVGEKEILVDQQKLLLGIKKN